MWSKCNSHKKIGPGKGGKLHFQTSPCSGSSRVAISLSAALTNMKLGRDIKLCDVTNIIMVKIM